MPADRVAQAMRAVARRDYLPPEVRGRAGDDAPVMIGHGSTNSQPRTVAAMLRLLDPRPGQRVLDVGSGSGWTTALLSWLTGPDGSVLGVELEPELVDMARAHLTAQAVPRVRVDVADADELGRPAEAPYDAILVSAEARELPPALLDQLADPGRMVIPVDGVMLLVVRRDGVDRVSRHGRYRFVPLR
ncbi:Protein-L-isoaspartate O-methyltransferase [Nocardioides dokdonensis FR1436]|uniref:Protein-L-isoaspartate O-methyltransferase n=1 Tax=Nocardioides dokdonensis FR1436 TaxID=1300347 RepID=A0A1A9GGV0_9ACTN|nr:protein-L-isoaspartate O-methyltransferase [Nocardioides dokdonensis]ANH37527.1 Protein-L-isoaspartate O-methyltransferase [Nocardioides dokdonensis FR1436]